MGSENDLVNLQLFEFPIETYKLEAMPKPWESTLEIGMIPDGETGVYNCMGT
jgi:hypothetical protein